MIKRSSFLFIKFRVFHVPQNAWCQKVESFGRVTISLRHVSLLQPINLESYLFMSSAEKWSKFGIFSRAAFREMCQSLNTQTAHAVLFLVLAGVVPVRPNHLLWLDFRILTTARWLLHTRMTGSRFFTLSLISKFKSQDHKIRNHAL